MKQNWRSLFLITLPLAILGSLASLNTARAQITPDNSLGAESSQVIPITTNIDIIDGGATRGSNLFHSFQEFNVNEGRGAFFNNPTGIENILSRVTGGNPSNILGALGVLGDANLFLINPNGIVFGHNARLYLGGSFFASTANSLVFDNNFEFSASKAQAPPLLTVNIPIGLRFRENQGKILVKGSGHKFSYSNTDATIHTDNPGLQVQPGKTLALVGGDVELEGGNLRAESGRIELGSVASPSLVNLGQTDSGFALGYSGVQNFGDIQLSQKASTDASGEGGGEIQVQGRQLSLSDGASILSISLGSKPGKNFTVNATESVELIGQSTDDRYASSLFTESQGSGSSGDLRITTGKLIIKDGAYVATYIVSSGNGGNLTVQAPESVELIGEGFYSSGLYTGTGSSSSTGKSGDLTIETGRLSIRDGALLFTSTNGSGNAGNVTVRAKDAVSLAGNAYIFSTVRAGGVGQGGNIDINAASLSLTDGAQLLTSIREASDTQKAGQGDAGNVNINVTGEVDIAGQKNDFPSAIFSDVETGTVGNGGNIAIDSGSFSLRDGAELNTSTSGRGNAGNVIVRAKDAVSLAGGDIFSTVRAGGVGKGGNIDINAASLSLTDGAQLLTSIREASDTQKAGWGDAGNVNVKVTGTVDIAGQKNGFSSAIFSDVETGTVGNGGNIIIDSGSFSLRDGAQLSTSTSGWGDAGSITINSIDNVSFDNSFVFTDIDESEATGNKGGNINISSGNLILDNSARLSASTYGKENAGSIGISTENLTLTNGSQLDSGTSGLGDAGSITINATDAISFDGDDSNGNPSAAFTTVEAGAVGKGGDINISAGSLLLTNGGQLNTFVRGSSEEEPTGGNGNAGNVNINVSDAVTIAGVSANNTTSAIFSNVESGATGNGGTVTIETQRLQVKDGAQVSASTSSEGQGGILTVTASDSVELSGTDANGFPSTIYTDTFSSGNAGKLTISTGDLIIRDGGAISASTFDEGAAGNLVVNATESVELLGTSPVRESGTQYYLIINGQFPSSLYTLTQGTGTAGNLRIETGQLIVRDGAQASVGSLGSVNAGNLDVNAGSIRLDNQGKLNAETASGNGGNINLNSDLLLLRRGGQISTNAGTEEKSGNGGNININSQFIVAVPNSNSDITANAYSGKGGNVNIRTQGIFGIQAHPKPTDTTNDITASSQLGVQGQITINQPNVDPTQGLVELPQTVIDPNALVAQNPCQEGVGSSFVITGRGGLPPSPNEALSNEVMRTRWIEPTSNVSPPKKRGNRTESNATSIQNPKSQTPNQVVPAQGWVFNNKGEVVLTAYDPTSTASPRLGANPASCPAPF
ncbi:two-partner secretion domain-containing protein [Fischerella sp. PCC 9605]|uniref:two-partner secretion domain-containing protein n=1 Tax=Fischerella sp. PCC 9605 TaxID=1173024 RepID=UPI0004B84E42|nr:filamentous hemagglutinin N-terminal domain-containing protein [Fischerella sp. PCC 9605]